MSQLGPTALAAAAAAAASAGGGGGGAAILKEAGNQCYSLLSLHTKSGLISGCAGSPNNITH